MITAKIIEDSIAQNGKRITTFELEYARFIHSEFMTHRMISKNSASSRAIPISAMIQSVIDNPAMPVYWGKNQSGMGAKEELAPSEINHATKVWLDARDRAIEYVKVLQEIGLHKQIANRILEPWAHMKVVATSTEWDNFFYLRRHRDAQPEIRALANKMYFEYTRNRPKTLYQGEWHLPYVSEKDKNTFTMGDCIKLSASLCAQVSYRKSDDSIEKAMLIYDRLVNSKPVHASPFEHQATPLLFGNATSGNFLGWEQYRQRIPGNVCNKYKPGQE